MSETLLPNSGALEYERPPSGPGGLIVEVRPDGVLLRLGTRSAWKELRKAIVSLTCQALIVTSMGINLRIMTSGVTAVSPALYWGAVMVLFGTLACVPFDLLKLVRAIARVVRRDALAGTQFFAAADQPQGTGVDPVRSVHVERAPLQATLTRPYRLKVVTARGKAFELLRGGPPEELGRIADELSSLLHLDAARTGGFPVTGVAR
jgi:hypothetical protein